MALAEFNHVFWRSDYGSPGFLRSRTTLFASFSEKEDCNGFSRVQPRVLTKQNAILPSVPK
jgi:hypothetical protein